MAKEARFLALLARFHSALHLALPNFILNDFGFCILLAGEQSSYLNCLLLLNSICFFIALHYFFTSIVSFVVLNFFLAMC